MILENKRITDRTATQTLCNVSSLKVLKRLEATKAIGRAYHKVNPNTASPMGMETEDNLGWASAAFDLMGMAGGSLGLDPSPNDSWTADTITMKNDASIILVAIQIETFLLTNEKNGRATHVPGLLLPGDETTYKFFTDNDGGHTNHKTALHFAVASVNPAKPGVIRLEITIWRHQEGTATTPRHAHVVETITIANGDYCSSVSLTNERDPNEGWTEVELSYCQVTGEAQFPSFGIAVLPTNTWHYQNGTGGAINSLRVVFTPHPDDIL